MKHFLGLIALLWLGMSPLAMVRADEGGGEVDDAPTLKETLDQLVPKLRADKNLIGLAAMLMVDGKPVASAVDGEREKGTGVALAIGDQFHLGSITKSITATMIARLVEQKQLAWDSTVGDVFGDVVTMHDDWRGATLEQLLTHTAGAPPNFPLLTILKQPAEGPERVRQRRKIVAAVLAEAPATEPGKAFAYSNVGFTIAGAMAEAKTGASWEDLVRREVFTPLKLTEAGFGPPKDNGIAHSQPRGHSQLGPWKLAVGEDDDNSPLIGPAGIVHMTLDELCRYGNEHLIGERGEGVLLSAETYTRLHTPKLDSYAYGWVANPVKDAKRGRLVWHNGSNTMWYAYIGLLPDQNAVLAVASNDGDIKAAEASATEILDAIRAALASDP